MAMRERLETVSGKRLRLAMQVKKMSIAQLSEDSGVSESTIKEIRSGKTASPRPDTISRLADALGIDSEYLTSEDNSHLLPDVDEELSLQEDAYGPSIRSALALGTTRTLWLSYDTSEQRRYPLDGVTAMLSDEVIEPPADFVRIRKELIRQNDELKRNLEDPSKEKSELGKPWFDGPSFHLQRYDIIHSEDGDETKSIQVRFGKSFYANNFTAKSTSASFLRRRALKNFQFLDQPIDWLASGVGVAAVVFCRGGQSFVACRRSDSESFRSREFDTSVVEGIHPKKDVCANDPSFINIYDALKRAVRAELNIEATDAQCHMIGFGVDLEYYQWNFLGFVETDLTYEEIKLGWQSASEKWETSELVEVSSEPADVARFLIENDVWSCGVAAVYFSLLKRTGGGVEFNKAFAEAFSLTRPT